MRNEDCIPILYKPVSKNNLKTEQALLQFSKFVRNTRNKKNKRPTVPKGGKYNLVLPLGSI